MTDTHTPTAEEFWDARYQASDRVFSGNPNTALLRETAELIPGRALDLGCGEGGDAIWLAEQGWHVTATDISPTALRRGADHAATAGVGDRIDWQQHDLANSFPAGAFDLVSAHFLHSPVELPRGEVLRTAAGAVAPGGTLLIVGHAGFPPWEAEPDPEVHFPTPDEVLADLALPMDRWDVLTADTYQRPLIGPDQRPTTRPDNTLRLRRHPA
ncbi:class I SAM-dependent methyltransferase [Streptomyces zagrosensis]|uniref:SAM-dependent methyltransferase n=1 Tax=Streptomyces zagrosensis TaxID=1042984 RepID=A0A7W9QA07_9ACTN|nr:class I SAM-dependent methyltransferase [Streptomyces zagrosensis]MBB5936304.1 SAM-dependent methyltransferase [Streptomyces zagrosensis]